MTEAVLSVGECRLLLAGRSVGRLAYVARQGRPDIVPVNYVLDGKDVLFRTGPGPKLQAADRGDTVAFEVDDLDEDGQSGWSVVVVGRLHRLSTAEAGRLAHRPEPRAAGPRRCVVRLEESRTTGRRLG